MSASFDLLHHASHCGVCISTLLFLSFGVGSMLADKRLPRFRRTRGASDR